jgi:hypothetical protein
MGFFGRGKKDRGQTEPTTPPGVTPLGGKSDVMQALMQPGSVERQMEGARRSMKLNQRGVQMPAILKSFTVGETTPMFGGTPADLELTVQPPDGTPYDVSVHQVFLNGMVETFAAQQQVTVKVDPDNPQSVMLWSGAIPDRMARLEQLRAAGLITEAEFQAKKARLPGGG